jgi:hypothetical protein
LPSATSTSDSVLSPLSIVSNCGLLAAIISCLKLAGWMLRSSIWYRGCLRGDAPLGLLLSDSARSLELPESSDDFVSLGVWPAFDLNLEIIASGNTSPALASSALSSSTACAWTASACPFPSSAARTSSCGWSCSSCPWEWP